MRKFAGLIALALLALPFLCFPSMAQAACSGSGITWNCPAGATSADLSSALASATDGATITFANGSYTWTSFVSFDNSKGATVICATAGGCNVTANGTVIGMNGNLSGVNNHLYRVSGFNFSGTYSPAIWFWGCGAYGSCSSGLGTLNQMRIDHNAFNMAGGNNWAIFVNEYNTVGNIYGVIDHNTTLSPQSSGLVYQQAMINPNPPPAPLGTVNNLFVEDNTITVTAMNNEGQGCADTVNGGMVYRHNTSTNCLVTSHGSLHHGGPQNYELYNNHIIQNSGTDSNSQDCYRCFHHQGSGEFVAFNNILTPLSGHNSDAIAMLYYRDEASLAQSQGGVVCDGTQTGQTLSFGVPVIDGNRTPTSTYEGYPCWHQPGRDFAGNLKPMYAWANAWSDTGAKIDLTQENYGGFFAQHRMADRDAFNAVGGAQTSSTSPFNGSTGVGYGTLANRPSTCSVGLTDSADAGKGGVGYFATDSGPQGTLFQCSSANAWVAWYTPYTYPHPLVSGTTTPAITSALSAGGTVGVAFNYAITASNNPTSFNATGLPAGLSVNTSTGVISGTPTVAGTSSVALSATNSAGTGTATLSLMINQAAMVPTITSPLTLSCTTVATESPCNYMIAASNNPTSFGATGLPSGLSVNTSNGIISGRPTVPGTFNVTISATNTAGTGSATLVITITAPPSITSTLTASGTVGSAFSYTITATNSPTSFTATGLPAGLSINTSTGVISGTPTAAGTSNVAISATNTTGTGQATLVITINPPSSVVLFGSQTIQSGVDSDALGNAEAFKAVASATGNAVTLSIYLDSSSTVTKLTAGIYTDSPGHPKTLLSQGSSTTLTHGAWNVISIPSTAITSGTTYWIAVLGLNSGSFTFRDAGDNCLSETSHQNTLTSLPATWTTGQTWSNSCVLSGFGKS